MTAHVYPVSNCGVNLMMPGHNGLFARQLPVEVSCFSHPDIHGLPLVGGGGFIGVLYLSP